MLLAGEVKADAAGAICADWSTREFGNPAVAEAIGAVVSFDWTGEILRSDEREAVGEDATYPSITFRIGSEHIAVESKGQQGKFDLEVCLLRKSRLLGLFKIHRFFEIKSASLPAVCEAIRVFYQLGSSSRMTFFADVASARNSMIPG